VIPGTRDGDSVGDEPHVDPDRGSAITLVRE